MISLLISFFLRKTFAGKTLFSKIVFEIISISLTIFIIYFASESFLIKNQDPNSTSLFSFLLVGEIALLIPAYFAERLISYFMEIKNNQFYQTLIGLGISPVRFLLIKTLSDCIFPILRISSILFFSIFYLNFYFDLSMGIEFLILQFFSLITYISMAFIAIVTYLQFNRGINLFYTFQSVATILGGAYFTTAVFPSYLKYISNLLPQTQILYKARLIFGHKSTFIEGYGVILLSSLFFLLVSYFLYNAQIKWLKKQSQYI